LLDLVPTVYPVLPTDARLAIQLFEQYAPQGVQARDLLHVAVMHNNDLSGIISADEHFDRITGINRLDPQELFSQAQSGSG
jgi:predicted nucleic acid-binding protein